jgi:hypothetical protein
MSAGAAVDVFGLRSNQIPDAVRRRVVEQFPRLGFKRDFAALLRAEAEQSRAADRGTYTASPSAT